MSEPSGIYEQFEKTLNDMYVFTKTDHLRFKVWLGCPEVPKGRVSCDWENGWSDQDTITHIVAVAGPGKVVASWEVPVEAKAVFEGLLSLLNQAKDARKHNDAIALLQVSRRLKHRIENMSEKDKITLASVLKENVSLEKYLQQEMAAALSKEWAKEIDRQIMSGGEAVREFSGVEAEKSVKRFQKTIHVTKEMTEDSIIKCEKAAKAFWMEEAPQLEGHFGDWALRAPERTEDYSIPERHMMYGMNEYGRYVPVASYYEGPGPVLPSVNMTSMSCGAASLNIDAANAASNWEHGRYLHNVYIVDPAGDGEVVAAAYGIIAEKTEVAIQKAVMLVWDKGMGDVEDYDILVRHIGTKKGWGPDCGLLYRIRPKEVDGD